MILFVHFSELLDKLEKELDDTEGQKHSNILTRTFQGKLVSQVSKRLR